MAGRRARPPDADRLEVNLANSVVKGEIVTNQELATALGNTNTPGWRAVLSEMLAFRSPPLRRNLSSKRNFDVSYEVFLRDLKDRRSPVPRAPAGLTRK